MKHFRRILPKPIFVVQKWLRKKLRITQKVNFSQRVQKVANPDERFQFDGKELFGHTCEIEQILTKIDMLLKMSRIQLSSAFQVFWSIFAWNWQKLLCCQKSGYLTRKLRITPNDVVFSMITKSGKSTG